MNTPTEPSDLQNRTRLFDLLSEFTANVVLDMVSNAYRTFGKVITSGDALPPLLLPVAESYFNNCVYSAQSRDDEYLNGVFDKMTAIKLDNTNHVVDLINLTVMLTLNCIYALEIRDVLTDDYLTSMKAVKGHVEAILRRYKGLISDLRGCASDHIHVDIPRGEKIFTFSVDKFTQTEKGPVKLSHLSM